jgi:ABC-type bacteriocin/lantibiotic exporter with double-glycine peptidase domain
MVDIQEMDLLHRADKREWSEIKDMIKWAFEDAFWVKIIQSPEGLRRNWDKMAVKQAKVDNKGITIEKNRTYAQQIKAFLEKEGDGKIIWLGIDFVQDRRTGDSIKFDLNHDTFKGIVNKWFGIREK